MENLNFNELDFFLIEDPHSSAGSFKLQFVRTEDGGFVAHDDKGEQLCSIKLGVNPISSDSHCRLDVTFETQLSKGAEELFAKAKWMKLGGLRLPDEPVSALANGYNCWSDSPMLKKDEILFGETDPVQEYFGDAWFYPYKEKEGEFHAWSYSIIDYGNGKKNSLIAGVCEDRFYNVIELNLKEKTYDLLVDIDGFDFTRLADMSGLLASFIIPTSVNSSETLGQLTNVWFDQIKQFEFVQRNLGNSWSGPVPVTGYTSWYNKFTDISESWLLDHIKSIKEKTNWSVFQVDDGYQTCVGDWLIPDKDFPDSVDVVIEKARSEGLLPGIWLAPFVAMEFSDLVKDNPEIVLKYPNGSNVVCGDFPHWGGKFVGLDTENDKFKAYIEKVVSHFASAGVKFIKADFLYGSSMLPRKGMSKAEVSSRAHQWFYELCRKYGIFFLSCGAQMSSAYGRCDFSRIGADVAIEWEAIQLETHKSRERPSARSSMTNTVTRAMLNGVMFHNDPDVVILREENTELTLDERIVLTKLNRDLGGLVFSSDSPHLFGPNEYVLLKEMEKQEPPLSVEAIGRLNQGHTYFVNSKDKNIEVTVAPRNLVSLNEKSS